MHMCIVTGGVVDTYTHILLDSLTNFCFDSLVFSYVLIFLYILLDLVTVLM